MTRIKDLPVLERPIERLINVGCENLSNEELISIILKCGTKEKSVKEISSQLLKENDIHELKNVTLEKIMKVLPEVVYSIVGVVLIFFVIVVLVPCVQVYMGNFLFSAYGF